MQGTRSGTLHASFNRPNGEILFLLHFTEEKIEVYRMSLRPSSFSKLGAEIQIQISFTFSGFESLWRLHKGRLLRWENYPRRLPSPCLLVFHFWASQHSVHRMYLAMAKRRMLMPRPICLTEIRDVGDGCF